MSSWGGYVFLINLIPLHVLVLMLTGRFSHRVYVAYSTVSVLYIPFKKIGYSYKFEQMSFWGISSYSLLYPVTLILSYKRLPLNFLYIRNISWVDFVFTGVLLRNYIVNADFICRFPAGSVQWTYGCKWNPSICLELHTD